MLPLCNLTTSPNCDVPNTLSPSDSIHSARLPTTASRSRAREIEQPTLYVNVLDQHRQVRSSRQLPTLQLRVPGIAYRRREQRGSAYDSRLDGGLGMCRMFGLGERTTACAYPLSLPVLSISPPLAWSVGDT